jgi:hypothetical protein
MISEEGGWSSTGFSKPNMRANGAGRYQNREIYDTARQESEDLWDYSAYQGEMHSNSRVKGSIAELTSVPYQVAAQNLPNQTFRDGYIPHSYDGVQSFWDNQGEDNQSMRPDLTPLEFAGMVQPPHILPKNPRYGNDPDMKEGGGDPDNIMVLRQKMRTSYALPPKAAAKFVDEQSSRTMIDTLKQGPGAAGRNRGITLTATEEYQQTMQEAARPTQGQMLARGLTVDKVMADLSKLQGAFSADTWGETIMGLGGFLYNQVKEGSTFYNLAQNLRATGNIPSGIFNEAMARFSNLARKRSKQQKKP